MLSLTHRISTGSCNTPFGHELHSDTRSSWMYSACMSVVGILESLPLPQMYCLCRICLFLGIYHDDVWIVAFSFA